MNAYDVLFDHHNTLRGLCSKITAMPPTSAERRDTLDELLVELDIHMRIEDDLFYPAVQAAASKLVAISHAEHRQVIDQLTVVLRTPPQAPDYHDDVACHFVEVGVDAGDRRDPRSAHAGGVRGGPHPQSENRRAARSSAP